jgi:hypothetical protein
MTEAVGILNGPARRLNPCTNAEILYLLQCTRAIGKHHATMAIKMQMLAT